MTISGRLILALSVAGAVLVMGLYGLSRGTAPARAQSSIQSTDVGAPSAPAIPHSSATASAIGHVRVLSPSRAGVAGAQVTAYRGVDVVSAKSDDDGIADVPISAPGRYRLGVSAAGYAEWFGNVTFPADVDVLLLPGGNLVLELRDPLSKTWEGLRLRVLAADGPSRNFDAAGPSIDAGFWLPGSVQVQVLQPTTVPGVEWYLRADEVALMPGRTVHYPVEVPVLTKSLLVRATDHVGAPVALWSAFDCAEGSPGGDSLPTYPTDQAHAYRLDVPFASHVVRLEAAGHGPGFLRLPSQIEADKIYEVTLAASARLLVEFDPPGHTVASVDVLYRGPSEKETVFPEVVSFHAKGAAARSDVPNTGDAADSSSRMPLGSRIASVDASAGQPAEFGGLPALAVVAVEGIDGRQMHTHRWVRLGAAGSVTSVRLDWSGLVQLDCEVGDAKGPLAGAFVDVVSADGSKFFGTLRADENGHVTVRGLQVAEKYALKVSHCERYGLGEALFVIPEEIMRSEWPKFHVRFAPTGMRQASVRVLNADGAGVANQPVVFATIGGGSIEAWTDKGGVAAAGVPADARVHATVVRGAGRPSTMLWIDPGAVPEVVLADATDVLARVTWHGAPAVLRVELSGSAGTQTRHAFVDGQGIIRFRDVEPGSHVLRCSCGHAEATKSFVATRDVETIVDVALEQG